MSLCRYRFLVICLLLFNGLATPIMAADAAEQQLWESVQVARDPVQIMLFLRAYPSSQHEEDARALLFEVMNAKENSKTVNPDSTNKPVTTTDMDTQEKQLIEIAQKSGLATDYETYLQNFPEGIYAELATIELQIILQKETPVESSGTIAQKEPTDVTFTSPLTSGGPDVQGFNIKQLIVKSPLFSPIDGIPESLWKHKECATCHSWTREALCTQGETYNMPDAEQALTKKHPYGGAFKESLKIWASTDCK